MNETITFVGLDVHKASLSVSIAEGGELRFCYERAAMGSGAT